MHYFRRKAFDSAILYFKDVVKKYPATDYARKSQLKLVQAYDAISYKADRDDTCTALRERYPADSEGRARCGNAPVASVAPSTPTP